MKYYTVDANNYYKPGMEITLQKDLINEMLLESLRRSEFKDKSSRFQSIFAFENLEDAKQFRSEFREESCRIFEIETDALVHKADVNLLGIAFPMVTAAYYCYRYWQGKSYLNPEGNSNPLWEILIPLPAKIGNEVK